MKQYSGLEVIKLGGNQIKDMKEVKELSSLKDLKSLDFEGNPVSDTDDFREKVYKDFEELDVSFRL